MYLETFVGYILFVITNILRNRVISEVIKEMPTLMRMVIRIGVYILSKTPRPMHIVLVIMGCWFLYKRRFYFNNLIIRVFGIRHQDLFREKFREIQDDLSITIGGRHSHPQAAESRTCANDIIDNYIHSVGFKTYSVSGSNKDFRRGNDGNRYYYFAKDLNISFRADIITDKHILKFIDVDYYADMKFYASYGQPMISFSFYPLKVGGVVSNATYTIIDDYVHYSVNGGSKYVHQIPNYEVDVVVFDYWWGSRVYNVESFVFREDSRRIVGLFPAYTVYGPFSWLITGERFSYRKFSHKGFNENLYQYEYTDAGKQHCVIHRSFNICGDRHSASLPDKLFRTAKLRCDMSKTPAISDVERIFRTDESIKDPAYCASVFLAMYNAKAFRDDVKIISCNTVLNDKITYQTLTPLITEDGTPTATPVGPPIYEGNFPYGLSPAKSLNNDKACIEGRIEKVRAPFIKAPPFYHRCAREFIDHLVGDDTHSGTPISTEEVEILQNRPTQRAGNIRARIYTLFDRVKVTISSFQKKEIYSKLSDPRNISTLPPDHRLRYSAYIYSLAKIFKRTKWYAFGQTPKEISENVHYLISRSHFVVPTDFSRFDGTMSNFFARYESELMLHFFAPVYHTEVIKLHDATLHANGYTAHGLPYNLGFSRASGKADTSLCNSFCNALTAYIVYRHTQGPREAWNNLGIYGGDDGINPEIDIKTFETVSSRIGLKLKAEKILPGNPVPFLGRIFLDPWTSPNNICDVKRRLNSLHLSISPKTVPPWAVLLRKATSYLTTDPHTPVISHWSRMIKRIYSHLDVTPYIKDTINEANYFSYFEELFCSPPANDKLALDVVSSNMGVTALEICSLIDRLNNIHDEQQFQAMLPFCVGHRTKVEIPAVVDGTIHEPQSKPISVKRNDDNKCGAKTKEDKPRYANKSRKVSTLSRAPPLSR